MDCIVALFEAGAQLGVIEGVITEDSDFLSTFGCKEVYLLLTYYIIFLKLLFTFVISSINNANRKP